MCCWYWQRSINVETDFLFWMYLHLFFIIIQKLIKTVLNKLKPDNFLDIHSIMIKYSTDTFSSIAFASNEIFCEQIHFVVVKYLQYFQLNSILWKSSLINFLKENLTRVDSNYIWWMIRKFNWKIFFSFCINCFFISNFKWLEKKLNTFVFD